jgi:hypothetical protein
VLFQLPAGTIRDALSRSRDSRCAYILSPTGGSNHVSVLDPLTGATTPVLTNQLAPHRLAFGRKGELYVLTFPIPDLTSSRILCINIDSGQVNNVTATKELPFSTWYGALAYDDATDKVLALHAGSRMIYKISAGLPAGEGLTGQVIPPSVPMHLHSGLMAVNPVNGKIWFTTPAANKLFNVEGNFAPVVSEINIAGVTSITGIDFDDAGHLYVTADGTVREYEQTGPNTWQLVANPYFENIPAGERVTLSRSRTNYDPIKHPASQWVNIDPSQLADFAPGVSLVDCLADIDNNRVVNIDDLLLVVNNWGAPRPNVANIDESNFVDIDDLLAVINAWGLCP